MALVPDQKFSTFQAGGTPTTGDIIVGLRGGINTKFNWVLPVGVDTITGMANQVLVNGSGGVPVTGDVTLTTPQDIATTSSPTFVGLTLSQYISGVLGIKDANGNIVCTFNTDAADATEWLQFFNGKNGDPSAIAVDGIAADVQLDFYSKGLGQIAFNSAATVNQYSFFSGTSYQHQTVFNMPNTANTRIATWQDSDGTVAWLSDIPAGTPSAMTKVDDTNVTLTLGGTPATSLLQAVSLTMGWTGTLSPTRGGTGVNNGSNTLTLAGTLATSGAFASTFTMTGATNVTFPTSGTLATTAGTVSSVSGTANRITSTGGTTPVIDISASYVGQSSITTLGTIGTGTWQGTVIGSTYGGTGVNNGSSTFTMGGNVTFSGAFTFAGTLTGNTAVTFPTSGTLATTTQLVTPAALTKTDDTNVTLTLGGSPSTALVNAASLTLGWTGQLGLTRGGTAASLTASNGGIVYSTASALAILAGTATAGQMLQSGASAAPAWSTSTYPATNAINTLLYASSANVMAALATANNGVLVTSAGGVPSISSTLPSGIAATNMNLTTPTLGVATATSLNFGASATNGLIGVTGATSAAAGVVGEVITSNVPNSTTSLTTNTNADTTSISLTAGDWDVFGSVSFNGAAGTGVIINLGWISLTSATLPDATLYASLFYSTGGAVLPYSIAPSSFVVPSLRVNVSTTTTVYLTVRSAFITSTSTAGGTITARRRR